jgi:ribosomal peptide maturation radical SAM protein 1
MSGPDFLDPAKLALLRASFRMVNHERLQRLGQGPMEVDREADVRTSDPEAARLGSLLRAHFASLSVPELENLRATLAQSFLIELDRNIASPGDLPAHQLDPNWAQTHSPRVNGTSNAAKLALVSLPWMSPALPSIQLGTLSAALRQEGISCDVHELYVDYAARIGLNLYNRLGNLHGFLPEWMFSRHYYREETGKDSSGVMALRSLEEWIWPEVAQDALDALDAVTHTYLNDMLQDAGWSQYDLVGCSLTISQLGASMAFARRLQQKHPQVKIIFGGSQCAGPMGRAILRICPYVDAVVHVEGELVLAEMVRRYRGGESLEGLPGISYRSFNGEIVTGPPAGLFRGQNERPPISYDSYFQRLSRLNLLDKLNTWVPFESSRGCWYGQKTQCTFCGLHETMEFRSWKAEAVLGELERLYERYKIPRFYAVDLILPRDYLHTLLPEIAARNHDWIFFWEVKANMRREELEVLAAAGVRWVQPGIESLDADILRLMRKGVSPLQNIQLLKWSEELGIFCGWNMIHGLPGETRQSHQNMIEMIPKLHHLRPPSGSGKFQLHRFSPYFEHPEEFQIQWTGAHPSFKDAFPIPTSDLDELVYLHNFVALGDSAPPDGSALENALKAWGKAYERGASLKIAIQEDGSSVIEDKRRLVPNGPVYRLTPAETELYLFLDSGVKLSTIASTFLATHPEEAHAIQESHGIDATIERWLQEALVLATEKRVVSLALQPEKTRQGRGQTVRPPVFDSPMGPLVSIEVAQTHI